MKINVVSKQQFEIRYVDPSECKKHARPYGTMEVLDADGDRLGYYKSLQEATDAAVSWANYDSEFADVEIEEIES